MFDFRIGLLLSPFYIGNSFTNENINGGVIYDKDGKVVDYKFEIIKKK